MSTLREQYQEMTVENLEDLLSNAVLNDQTKSLIKTVINEKLGNPRYEVTRLNDVTSNLATDVSVNSQKKSKSSTPVSGFVFLLFGSVTLPLFVHMPGVYINTGGGSLLPIGALVLLWIGSKRLRSWPFVVGAVFIVIGLFFLAAYNDTMPATAQYPGLRLSVVGSSVEGINLGNSIPTIAFGALLILFGVTRSLWRSRKKH